MAEPRSGSLEEVAEAFRKAYPIDPLCYYQMYLGNIITLRKRRSKAWASVKGFLYSPGSCHTATEAIYC